MANIGLIAMSAKPYHAGHDGLVRWAANENDIVYLFVSLSDRNLPSKVVQQYLMIEIKPYSTFQLQLIPVQHIYLQVQLHPQLS